MNIKKLKTLLKETEKKIKNGQDAKEAIVETWSTLSSNDPIPGVDVVVEKDSPND